MKKKWFCAAIISFAVLAMSGCYREEVITIDPFDDIKVEFSGFDGQAKASVDGNVEYNGDNETLQKLIKSIHYEIDPNENLSNGQTIKVKVRYSKDLAKLSNVEFEKEDITVTVVNLIAGEKNVTSSIETMIDENGNEIPYLQEVITVDGVDIPSHWNLSEEEIEAYLKYKKEIENIPNEIGETDPIQVDWIKGENTEKTNRKDEYFYVSDYLDNSVTCYNEAYNYGLTSSQEFRIENIIQDMKFVGYRCVFKSE